MPRRKYKIRQVEPDTLYGSFIVSKLVNIVMKDGKKSIAENIVYNAFDKLKEQKLEPVVVMETVLQNVGPRMTVKSRRIGGASYMVPKETTPKHKMFLGLSWLVAAARARSNKEYHTFADKLVNEIVDAYNNKGAAVDKKSQTEKTADANKVFAHFGW